MADFALVFRKPGVVRLIAFGAYVVLALSVAQALRVTWRRSRARAAVILAVVGLYSGWPVLLTCFTRPKGDWLRLATVWPLAVLPIVVGGAVTAEYFAGRFGLDAPNDQRNLRTGAAELASRPRRRLRRRLAIVAGVLVTLLLFFVVYPRYKVGAAHRQAEALCAHAIVGGPVAGLEARGKELGLVVWTLAAGTRPDGSSRPATITGWNGWMFARWHCIIEHESGKVIARHTGFLD